MSNKIAIVRIRGKVRLTYGVKKTFESLNLHKQNWCIVLENEPKVIGMLKKVKDYVTWGELSPELEKELFEKRGEEFKGISKNFIEHNKKKYKKYFRLNPPSGGYERKGVKMAFSTGGALGYRGDKINDLVRKMI